MKILTYTLVLCIILLGSGFALLNHLPVTINYYFGEFLAPISIVVTVSFVAGAVIGMLAGLYFVVKAKLSNFKLTAKLKSIEKCGHD